MIDSGATGIFIDRSYAKKLGLRQIKRKKIAHLTLFDGSNAEPITHQVAATLKVGDAEQKLVFDITPLGEYQVILGLPWLQTYNPNIDWANETITLHGNKIALSAASANVRSSDLFHPLIYDQALDELALQM